MAWLLPLWQRLQVAPPIAEMPAPVAMASTCAWCAPALSSGSTREPSGQAYPALAPSLSPWQVLHSAVIALAVVSAVEIGHAVSGIWWAPSSLVWQPEQRLFVPVAPL